MPKGIPSDTSSTSVDGEALSREWEAFLSGDPALHARLRETGMQLLQHEFRRMPLEDRKDIVGKAFQVLLSKRGSGPGQQEFRLERGLFALLRQIIRRDAIDWVRKNREAVLDESLPDPHPDVLDEVADLERRDLLHRAALQLSHECQELFLQHYWLRQTYDEIAQAQGQRPGTIKSRLHRCIQQIRSLLVRRGVVSFDAIRE